MSKIGRTPIHVPESVTVTVKADAVTVKGPQGELSLPSLSGIKVKVEADQVLVTRTNDKDQTKANHGLMRSLINNHVIGVTEGYKKTLKMVGTGYRVQAKGKNLNLQVGFSHDVSYECPAGIEFQVEGNDTIIISGIDKQQVGQTAAEIRQVKPPEPYKGKGIRYEGEYVRRKQGKAAVT